MTANGTLADNQLVTFYGVRLAPQAAADAGRMVNAAARVGHVVRPLLVKEAAAGYRSRSTQQNMITAQKTGHAADYHLLPSPPAPRLAPVGYSRHGQGRACDWVWSSASALTWLRQHGAEFGWTFWDSKNDPPHMEHDAAHSVVTWTEPGLAPAGGSGRHLTKGTTMYAFSYTSATAGVETFLAEPGLYVKGCTATQPGVLGIPVNGPLSIDDLTAAMWDLGFDDMVGGANPDAWTFLSQHCVGGKTVFTTAWAKAQTGGSSSAPTDAQITAIADQVVAKLVPQFAALPAAVIKAEGAALAKGA